MEIIIKNYGCVMLLLIILFIYWIRRKDRNRYLNKQKQHNKFKSMELTESNDCYQYKTLNPFEYTYKIIQLNRNGQVIQKKVIDIGNNVSIPGGFTPQFRRLETGVPM